MPLVLPSAADRAAPPKDLEIRPKQVKAWLDSLPLAQANDACRRVIAHLTALNRSKVDTDDRLQILEAYRPIARTLLEEMEAVYGKALLPLAPRPREALEMARALAGELATGYKVVLAEKSGKLIAFGAKKQVPLLLLRIMQYNVARMLAGYKSYTATPAGAWSEIHQVFLQAEREGIAGEAADPETKGSIAELYCETLLLSLVDPYRLSQGEVDKVIAQIRGSRAPVTLSQARPQTRPGGHFLVPCDTDKPPKPALSANDETGGPNWRIFDTNPIVEKLRARKNAIETGNVSATTSRTLGPDGQAMLAKLITLWGDPPKRASRRDPMEHSVPVCVGLKGVTHFLSIEADDREAEARAIREGNTMPLVTIPDDEVSRSMNVLEWEVVNQSDGGMKVRRTGGTLQPLLVGEVVGLRLPGRPGWTVGVVRWITGLEEGGMEFGVQFLAAGARHLELAPTIAAALPQPKPAILLLDDLDPDNSDMVLAASGTFSELREFHVEDLGKGSIVRARGLIEKTARFDLFHVSPS
jgi:hypothetical protein